MIAYTRIRKNMSRIAGILAGLIVFITISHTLDEMYVDVDAMAWYRILWHYFYEDEGKIENLYLGSSHVYRDIDPSILDGLNGRYNFNLASNGQPLNGTYYLLREADRRNELQHVYLEMYYVCNFNDNSLNDYHRNWGNTDYMKASLNKAEYITTIGGVDQLVNILLPFTRYRAELGDWTYIKEQLALKAEENYRNYQYVVYKSDGSIKDNYEKQGYIRNTSIYDDSRKIFLQERILSGYSIGEKNEEYCRRIIEYCRDKGIPITLYVSPIYHLQLLSTLDYDDYIEKIRALAAEYEIPFYDFNLVREEYLAIQEGKFFFDEGHLNQDGGELFTPFFYQVVSGKEADNEKYFYKSYREKLEDLPPAIFGVYYTYLTEQEQKKTMWVASNRDFGMEYRIILTPEEGEQYTVQDFSENKEFQVPPDEKGVCTIVARVKGESDEVQTMEINY